MVEFFLAINPENLVLIMARYTLPMSVNKI